MNVIKYRVSLDIFDTFSQAKLKAKKGDSACEIHITLTDHGRIYKIGEGCSATFNAKKSDGNFICDNCDIEGDTIIYKFTSSNDENGVCQVSACEGMAECEITVCKANGEQLTSPRFSLYIDGTVYNGEDIISTPESNVLKTLITDAKNTIENIETKLENGEFDGDDYVLTDTDKQEIADLIGGGGSSSKIEIFPAEVPYSLSTRVKPIAFTPSESVKDGKEHIFVVIPDGEVIFNWEINWLMNSSSLTVLLGDEWCSTDCIGDCKVSPGQGMFIAGKYNPETGYWAYLHFLNPPCQVPEIDTDEIVNQVIEALPKYDGGVE